MIFFIQCLLQNLFRPLNLLFEKGKKMDQRLALVARLLLLLLKELLLLRLQVSLLLPGPNFYFFQAAVVGDLLIDGSPQHFVCAQLPHAVGGGVEGQHVFDEEHRQAGQLQGARKGDKERGAGGSGVPLA